MIFAFVCISLVANYAAAESAAPSAGLFDKAVALELPAAWAFSFTRRKPRFSR